MDQGIAARCAGADWLARALGEARADTLLTSGVYEHSLGGGLQVPYSTELNPPLWELGHIGWFQDFWLSRNPQWRFGVSADPLCAREAGRRANADDLYDSSRVPHGQRWHLALPGLAQTRAELSEQLAHSLSLLRQADGSAEQLYFFRLALLHEDMHHEAALYMAQSLGIAITDPRWQPRALGGERVSTRVGRSVWQLGETDPGAVFYFDNELGRAQADLAAFEIDSRVVSWAEYLPFVDSGGPVPRYLRRAKQGWQQQRWGVWQDLTLAEPAVHLSAFEAEAWCAWAGRRLPTEAEWHCAARTLGSGFAWGQVWEWTASEFRPFDGFKPHPYLDYSQPWFGQRRVLRGASLFTQARLRHLGYRNFFVPARNDIAAGFRSCAAR